MSDIQTAPSPQNGEGWVVMFHPDLDAPDGKHVYTETTVEAYENVWKPKGWSKVDPAAELRGMLKDDLVELASARGVDTSGTKDELIERLGGGDDEGGDD